MTSLFYSLIASCVMAVIVVMYLWIRTNRINREMKEVKQ